MVSDLVWHPFLTHGVDKNAPPSPAILDYRGGAGLHFCRPIDNIGVEFWGTNGRSRRLDSRRGVGSIG